MGSKTGIGILTLLVVACAARLVFCGFVVGWNRAPAGDEVDYHAIAQHLADGKGFRLDTDAVTARRTPLYPLVLAALYRVVGVSVVWGRVLQVLLGTAIVALVFAAARRYFTVGAAWIAASLVAVNPLLIFISAYLLTENLYTVLLLGAVLVPAKGPPPAVSGWRAVMTGILLGLACLCRPTAWPVVLWIAGAMLLLRGGALANRLLRSLALVAAAVVVLFPWALRNHAEFGRWMFFTAHGGITFYQGNNPAVLENPQYRGGVAPLYVLPGYDRLKTMPEIRKDDAAREMGRAFLRENAKRVPLLVWRKFVRFWRFKSDVGLSGVKSGWWWNKESRLGKLASTIDLGFVYSLFVIPLFVLGFLWNARDSGRFVFLGGLVLVHLMVSLVFHGSLRMRIPIEPVMAMFAADACWRIATRVRMFAPAR